MIWIWRNIDGKKLWTKQGVFEDLNHILICDLKKIRWSCWDESTECHVDLTCQPVDSLLNLDSSPDKDPSEKCCRMNG